MPGALATDRAGGGIVAGASRVGREDRMPDGIVAGAGSHARERSANLTWLKANLLD
nr:hypothetical protein [Gammaproteobacteria bacterium]